MNILYIAFSCSAYHGSEDKIGWNIPLESAKNNRVFVITRESQRQYTETFLKQHPVKNLAFYYISLPNWLERLLRPFLYTLRLNFWHRKALPLAKEICIQEKIGVIHQITPIEFRSIGNYGAIPGAAFVCGPLGGGEYIPKGLESYAARHRHVEWLRRAANLYSRASITLLRKFQTCDCVLFANRETQDYLRNAGIHGKSAVVTEVGIDEQEFTGTKKDTAGTVTILVPGRLIYRKGHAFLLDALERLPEGLDYRCRIVGGGKELEALKHRCAASHIASRVVFTGQIPYEQMEEEYQKADAVVMPSLRETGGAVIMEAMAKGLPVITIDRFGGGMLVDAETGWLYGGNTREEYVENLASAIAQCVKNPAEARRRGNAAAQKAKEYTWEKKLRLYQSYYDRLQDMK